MTRYEEIAARIREIAGVKASVRTGKVTSVDTDDMTCNVELTGMDEGTATTVLLNVVLENKAGTYAVPKSDADCLVMLVDGGGRWELLKASAYDRVYVKGGEKFVDVTDDVVLLNGDGKGGLVIAQNVADKIKALEDLVNNILQTLQTTTIPLAPSGTYPFAPLYASLMAIAPTTSKSDLENKNVMHG